MPKPRPPLHRPKTASSGRERRRGAVASQSAGFWVFTRDRKRRVWASTRCRLQEVERCRSAAGIVTAAAGQGFPPSKAHTPTNHQTGHTRSPASWVSVGGRRTRRVAIFRSAPWANGAAQDRDPRLPPTRRPHGQARRPAPSTLHPPSPGRGYPRRRWPPPPHHAPQAQNTTSRPRHQPPDEIQVGPRPSPRRHRCRTHRRLPAVGSARPHHRGPRAPTSSVARVAGIPNRGGTVRLHRRPHRTGFARRTPSGGGEEEEKPKGGN